MKKNRIISGVLAAALAIVPFTGTGIDSIDKELTKETAITADAANYNYRGGIYRVNVTHWVGWTYHHKQGDLICIANGGYYNGVDVAYEIKAGWISYCWS